MSQRASWTASQLADVLGAMELVNNKSKNSQPSQEQLDPANESTLPLQYNPGSVTVSLEHSFGSLRVTDEDWLAIDEETQAEHIPTTKGSQPTSSGPLSITPESHHFKFSPSVLAHHANTACEKMLHLKGRQLWDQAKKQKENPGAVAEEQEKRARSPVTIADATTRRGVVFESQLQSRIKNRIDCEAERDRDSFFRLATTPDNTTLCQPIFSLDKSFYTPAMEKAGIVFGRFIPDFIEIRPGSVAPDGTRKKRLFIIDAKSSSHVKISHQVSKDSHIS